MNASQTSRPELLAPAGDWESLRAATLNGADAVYFGLSKFSARQRAVNFKREELPEVIAYLHGHNVRGYVAFNTLLFAEELEEAAALAADIAAAGADAIIVQDLGLARLIHRLAPTMPLHASTQMTLTDARGIELVRPLGIQRVILARELSIEQIRRLRQGTDMPLEVFVHGALCMSYSGQCLASEALWGRSANRGLCGQACRLPYRLLVDGRQHDTADRLYLLSTKDLAAYDRIYDLVRLGVSGFKIEGRLKSAHYVAAATQVYRAAIDAALENRRFELEPDGRARLVQSFSRGFTHGFLDGADHADLVHGLHPKSRGLRVGTVIGKTDRGLVIMLDEQAGELHPGDGVVLDEGREAGDEQGGRLFAVEELRDPGTVLVTFSQADVNLKDFSVGCDVWKTDDPRLEREMERTYARDAVARRVPLNIHIEAHAGQRLIVRATDDAGNHAEVTSEAPLEPAINRPLTLELAREQLGRLGETPFELAAIEITGDSGPTKSAPVMTPKSVLNDLRRQLTAALLEARAAKVRHVLAEPDALAALRAEIAARRTAAAQDTSPLLHVLCRNLGQVDAALSWSPPEGLPRPASVYCDFADAPSYADAVALGRTAGMPVALATLRIGQPGDEKFLDPILEAAPDAVLVRHLSALSILRERAPELPLVGDFSLNIANDLAADLLTQSGLTRVTASLDLNLHQLEALAARFAPGQLEAIVHLHMPMMYTDHCLAAANLSRRAGAACGRSCDSHRLSLKDRIDAEHPLLFDARCGCTIYSAHVQSAIDLTIDLQRAGLRHFRIELLDEKPQEVAALLDLYSRTLTGQIAADDAAEALAALAPAGVRRGSWDFE